MILKYLRTQEHFDCNFETSIPAKQVYQMNDEDIEKLHNQICEADILLIQPVTDGYKNQYQIKQPPGALSTKTLVGKLKKKHSGYNFPGDVLQCIPSVLFSTWSPFSIR